VTDEAPSTEDELHGLVRQQFEEYADATGATRALAEKCRDYRDGKQLTDAELAVYKKRKQPPYIDNKIQDKCDTLLGIEKQMRTDPKAYPRNPQDESAAEVATDTLRYVADQNHYQRLARKAAADNLMVEGLCYGQVVVEKRKGSYARISMEHIRWDRGYYDIHSLKDDFTDKTYCGYFTWMDVDKAEADWPERKDVLDGCFAPESASGPDKSMDDKPRYTMQVRSRKRVQVFVHYFKYKGKWNHCVWCKGGFLEKPKVSSYKDEYGEPDCCIEIQALYRDADGMPYGTVQRYLDPQDAHNKRHSKMLHLLQTKQLFAQAGTFGDISKVREELHKPDGVIEFNTNEKTWEVVTNLDMAQGQFQLLQYTDQQLAQTGPNSALAGTSGDLSGVAKARDQTAGQLPISPLFEALDLWELRMYRAVWNRARQYWKGEMFIRVTDDEDKVRFVGLNQTVLVGDKMVEDAKARPEFQQMPPEQKQALIQQIAQHPAAQMPVVGEGGKPEKKNAIAEMDMDIIIDRGQDTVTVQAEEFSMLAEIAKGRPEVPFDILVEMSQLRSETKKRVLDRMKGTNDPQAQAQAQFQDMMQQLQAALAKANVEKTAAQAEQAKAAAVESQVDASVKIAEFTSPAPEGKDGQPGAKPAAKTSVAVN
jgi:hypothetical protein